MLRRALSGFVALVTVITMSSFIGSPAATAVALPSGFQEQIVFSGLSSPVDLEFAPDGRILVAEKGGRIKIFDDLADTTPTVFADLSANVHNQWDRGLLGMALAPNFPADPYVYVLYTYDAPPGQTAPVWNDVCANANDGRCVVTGRLSRLRASGDTMTGSEQVLLHDWCQQFPSHSIGDIAFGADGMLYVAAGDGASFSAVDYGQFPSGAPTNPCGDPANEGGALRSQDIRTSGDPAQLDGTLLRLDPATGAAAAGNPNIGAADPNVRRIVAHGLRNPYRVTMRPGTNETWISDTGWNTWEEVNRVVNPTAGVTNFGWPCWEGNARQAGYDSANLPICETLYTAPAGTHTAPFVAWNHSSKLVAGEACPTGSSSSTGVAFYPTAGGPYPAAYNGAVFFADYSRRCIWASLPSAPGGLPNPANVQTFVSDAASPVDLEVGPGGELYYADLGGTIRRVRYFPGNQPPTAVIDASPTQGPAPLTVTFNGTGSTDPDPADDGRLRYAWDFTNDGTTDATTPTASFTYTTAGSYTARLTVTDTLNATHTSTIAITPGNEAPTAVIDTPDVGTTWKVGDTLAFTGHATDPQQGTLPASRLNWDLVMHHCSSPENCHEHAIRSWTGVASGSFEAPDHEYPSYLELKLVATDQEGLTHTVTRRLDPKTVDLTFATVPSGLQLAVGSGSGTTPFSRTVIQGSTNSVSAPSPQGSSTFTSWSDGGAQTHEITAPTAATTYTATYATAPATQRIGYTQPGASVDSGATNYMNGSRFVTGSGPAAVTSMSVYMRNVQAAPNNQYQLAIYADANGSPGARVATSTTGTLTANSWNTRPISATLAANTAYWLVYNTNGDNNLSYDAGSANQGAWSASTPFGTWPATFGSSNRWNAKFSIYATTGADTTAPAVAATSPAGGATGVALTSPVTVRFNEAMAASTITAANLELRGPGGTLVNRTVAYDAATETATITPSAALAASTQYTVTVRTGVTDVAGNALAANHQFSFTTLDPSAPRFGFDQVGGSLDSGDMNYLNGSRFVNGATALPISQVSVYLKAVQAAPANQFQVAIYADANGSPGALVASSTSGTLTANAWNSRPVTATLAPNTAYWLVYNTNGDNNMSYTTGTANQGAWSASTPFGSWPATFGSSNRWTAKFSIYAS
ncbi:PQQ-dependent sugar dehydrogenase [Paractinoplanes atraurantiacus]|uniref:Glucose/arabinose dehydrogenase, beta-propeller fold n=1 Tax=Paractinoplanes atraurantiacus TaxID=1036182 RepID=A0A285EXG2_9ACTN|nr:PQQ-dependent sugar dehydrogenase [Actinoplanes atraurantiacus]SNY03735.1 Glucose/arabinose dehydrogenase, beta-propeller fold [Actinoplanes atraurantiacus]